MQLPQKINVLNRPYTRMECTTMDGRFTVRDQSDHQLLRIAVSLKAKKVVLTTFH